MAPAAKTARILIADDHALVRRGVAATLTEHPGWTVVAEAADGREALEMAGRLRPDVAVLDMTMPSMNGIDAARAILAASPETRILIVTVHESEQLIREVFRTGARGYLLKSDAGSELVAAVDALLRNRMYFTSKVAAVVMESFLRDGEYAEQRATTGPLSPREREIVQLLAEGRSNKDIARALQISVKTAETHRSNIMRKMHFGSLSDLVRYAIKNGMVQP